MKVNQLGDPIFGESDHLIGFECDGAAFSINKYGFAVPTGEKDTPLNFVILGTGQIPSSGWEDPHPPDNYIPGFQPGYKSVWKKCVCSMGTIARSKS
ncbi:MAG TPA: hypothetical protein VFS97_08880 [Nitrososphaeraceae archaeon]|nr:hypothetical protein [Nitrososphaeraceae archaeon]